MRSVPGIVKIENNLPPAQLSLELEVDRLQAEKFGADLNLVGSYVELFTGGLKVASYRPDHTTEEIDILARLPADYRNISSWSGCAFRPARGWCRSRLSSSWSLFRATRNGGASISSAPCR